MPLSRRADRLRMAFLAVCVAALAAAPARAGQASPSDPPSAPPRLKLSFSERIRLEASDNVAGLDDRAADGTTYLRFRTSLGAQWRPWEKLELGVRWTNENRYYLTPKTDPKAGRDYEIHELVFDSLYAAWTEPFGLPLTLTVGRQDIRLGEGFVFWEGGALDGSRTAYFNAARADLALGGKTTLTLLGLYQPRTDRLLPIVNDQTQRLTEQDEQAAGAYLSSALGGTVLEAYAAAKSASAFETAPAYDYLLAGGRVAASLSSRLSLAAEAAAESGSIGTRDKRGLGGYLHLDYQTEAALPWPAALTLGGFYLSGDDRHTEGVDESWDPVFGRWPKWNESLVYLFAKETGKSAYWSNLASVFAAARFQPAANVRLTATFHRLSAPRRTEAVGLWSGSGLDRGSLLDLKLQYDISKNLSGHMIFDRFQPGSFYRTGADPYLWVRFELLLRY